ncbi:hypothetical protein [Planococcus lenghuensis]|uniref:Uncharacterized protein n=1 Tax=Planococcus lenghuensis TaxID=2213202 RepID=A0A1Q2KWM3_9BACL|nr:hypothetical protein [Planococcus lenghuensis]AQQ52207.1 hypothetical protein B0X71_03145 [Planococcus lenghuensis]
MEPASGLAGAGLMSTWIGRWSRLGRSAAAPIDCRTAEIPRICPLSYQTTIGRSDRNGQRAGAVRPLFL